MPNARSARTTREKAAELRKEAERKAARARTIIAAVAVLAVILLAVGGTVLFRSLAQQEQEEKAAAQAPPANLYTPDTGSAGGILIGDPSATVTLEVYSDYICPICGVFEQKFGTMLKQYADEKKIKVVLHPVAILDRYSQGTNYSTRATNALMTVLNTEGKEKALAFHEQLFANEPEENTPGLPDSTLLALAEKAGVNRAAIEADVKNLKFESWVVSTTEKFTKDFTPGGTPTIVLNGKQIDNSTLDNLQAQLDAAIKK
jgi:protein-disulfide isomerase